MSPLHRLKRRVGRFRRRHASVSVRPCESVCLCVLNHVFAVQPKKLLNTLRYPFPQCIISKLRTRPVRHRAQKEQKRVSTLTSTHRDRQTDRQTYV